MSNIPELSKDKSVSAPVRGDGGQDAAAVTATAERRCAGRRPKLEWPTIFLAVAIYAGWVLLTHYHKLLPDWLLFLLGGGVIAWHSSFQHEVVHGHPTRWRAVNHALGFAPLSIWLPFPIYRSSHRLHHIDARLTDPLDDPESKYWTEEEWQRLSPFARAIECIQAPLLGRILVGPIWVVGRFLFTEAKLLVRGDRARLKAWFVHAILVGMIFAWLVSYCGMSIGKYLLFFVYPGMSILMLRSFAEHRAAASVGHRTAIVENASLFGLLFLNNNLHAVHHKFPAAAWYVLPALYRKNRDSFLAGNAGLVYNGYFDVLSRFLFKLHDQIVHPLPRVVLPVMQMSDESGKNKK